jgi:hypothetical protein
MVRGSVVQLTLVHSAPEMLPRFSSFRRLSFRKDHIVQWHIKNVPLGYSYFYPSIDINYILDELRLAIEGDRIRLYRQEETNKYVVWHQMDREIGFYCAGGVSTEFVAAVVMVYGDELLVRTAFPEEP